MPTKDEFIDAMAKHLPPSASDLRLLDMGGVAGDSLQKRRPDILVDVVSLRVENWQFEDNSVDAVVAYDTLLKPELLARVLAVMRSGGRFIVVNPTSSVDEKWVKTLENAGYIRILVEPAVAGTGVLIRGEKPHTTEDTIERVETIASRDADLLNLETFRGRFVHLLIVQTPNIPIWKRKPDDPITWHAVAVTIENTQRLLAFSSLPKAVNFMQSAVMAGFVQDVNKVGKFSKDIAREWQPTPLLNPILEQVTDYSVILLNIDHETAEASDE
ncbi:MAG: hypothetical protein AAF846_22445 [Chloroflexota bacterium]